MPGNNNNFTFGHRRILGSEEPPFALLCRPVSWLKKVDICVETFHLKCLMLTFAPGFFPWGVIWGWSKEGTLELSSTNSTLSSNLIFNSKQISMALMFLF